MDLKFRAIKQNLLQNKFPSNFVDKCINQFLNKKLSHKAKNQNTAKPISFALFKLLYLGSISHYIEKELH